MPPTSAEKSNVRGHPPSWLNPSVVGFGGTDGDRHQIIDERAPTGHHVPRWLVETAASGINYFVLMNRVYAPRVRELRAHRIGIATRMVNIFPSRTSLVRWAHIDSVPEYLLAGTYWLRMVLAFEWVGSFLIRRSVREVPEGWQHREGLHVALRAAGLPARAADRQGCYCPGRLPPLNSRRLWKSSKQVRYAQAGLRFSRGGDCSRCGEIAVHEREEAG